MHQLPDAEFITELRRLSGTPELVLQDRDLLDLFLPLLRADLAVYETYLYTAAAPLDCPITVFGGLQDRCVAPEALEAWRDQTSSTFTSRMLPGNHFFIHSDRQPLLQAIARDLTLFLHQASGGQQR